MLLLTMTLGLLSPSQAIDYETCKVAVESSVLIENSLETNTLKEVIKNRIHTRIKYLQSIFTPEQLALINAIPTWQLPRGIHQPLIRAINGYRPSIHPDFEEQVCEAGTYLQTFSDGYACQTSGGGVERDDLASVLISPRGYAGALENLPGLEVRISVPPIPWQTRSFPIDLVKGEVIGDYLGWFEDRPPAPHRLTQEVSQLVSKVCDAFKGDELLIAKPKDWAHTPTHTPKNVNVDEYAVFLGDEPPVASYNPEPLGDYVQFGKSTEGR